MKIAVFGTGMVGQALATRLQGLGHAVTMGARSATNEKALAWADANGGSSATFADAAAEADLVVLALLGEVTLDVAKSVADKLDGKVVIDITNPLDMSKGFPPLLLPDLSGHTSLGEELQKALPGAAVVKTLNTMNCDVMVDPTKVPGDHDVFLCGNDAGAKAAVVELLKSFGWADPIDLDPIEAARGTEGLMNFWLRMYAVQGNANFNYKIVRAT